MSRATEKTALIYSSQSWTVTRKHNGAINNTEMVILKMAASMTKLCMIKSVHIWRSVGLNKIAKIIWSHHRKNTREPVHSEKNFKD